MIIISWCRLCALFFSYQSVAVVFKMKQKQTQKEREAGKENNKIQRMLKFRAVCQSAFYKGQRDNEVMLECGKKKCTDPSSSCADLTDCQGITCVV